MQVGSFVSSHTKTEEFSEMEADDEPDDWYVSNNDSKVLD